MSSTQQEQLVDLIYNRLADDILTEFEHVGSITPLFSGPHAVSTVHLHSPTLAFLPDQDPTTWYKKASELGNLLLIISIDEEEQMESVRVSILSKLPSELTSSIHGCEVLQLVSQSMKTQQIIKSETEFEHG